MRGEKEKDPQEPIFTDDMTKVQAIAEVTASEKRKRIAAAASVVDREGRVIYHVVSTLYSKAIIALVIMMMLICTLVSMLAYYNVNRVNKIQEELKKDVPPTNTHFYNG